MAASSGYYALFFMSSPMDKQLLHHVQKGDVRGAEKALQLGACIRGDGMRKPLHVAARFGREDVITMLAAKGADLEATVPGEARGGDGRLVLSRGSRAAHAAVYAGKVGAVRALVEAGANPDAADDAGHTPLMQACRSYDAKERAAIVRELLGAGADPALQSDEGMVALHFAALRDAADVIELLVRRQRTTLNQATGYGGTPLCCAASSGYTGAVSCLLSLGASDRALWREKGASALIGAVQEGREGVVAVLLGSEDVDAAVGGGAAAISKAIRTAVRKGEARILQMLLGAAAEEEEERALWAQEVSGGVPLLSHAAAAGSLAVVNILLRAGAREDAGLAGDRPSECIGAALAGGIDAAQGEAVARTLRRGPAYRARSSAWPAEAGADGGGATRPAAQLGVRIFRPDGGRRGVFTTRFSR